MAQAPVTMGQVVWTGPHGLHCQAVAHAAAAADGAICIQRAVLRTLFEAERRAYKTITFPALGTGVGGVPHGLGARLTLEAMRTFASFAPRHCRTIRIALLDDDALAAWTTGLTALDADAFILTPGGAHGPAFLALENFMVIKRYNMSDLYALFVGDLADRIGGTGTFEAPWGAVRQLSSRGIEEIQERLQARGYDIAKVDGKAGMNTRALIGAYQDASRLKVDCWPSEAVLGHLRKTAAGGKGAPRPVKSTLGPGTVEAK